MRIAQFGLGRMGSPIARGLAEAGHEVVGFDPKRPNSTGAAAQAAASVDVVVTVLPGSAEIAESMPAVLAAMRPGSLWLDLTSSDPSVVERFAFDSPHVDVVGAPMAGGPTAADARTLRFFVGATPAALARAEPLLTALGTVDHVGSEVTAGYTAKLLANLLWFGQVVAVTEALLLGQALGIAPATLRTTLASSAGGSVFIDEYLDSLLAGDYLQSFGIDRVVEELEILAALARREGVPFELSTTVARLHREALERFGAVEGELLAARLLEERGGRTLRQ